ncbi:MAG: hypothetical protein JST00_32155 [Deltaproteobacteria bacterium]|nr:hypothetical protein [Deltaproteobacteria bacterium]
MRRVAPFFFSSCAVLAAAVASQAAACDGVGGVASEVAAAHGAEHSAYCDRRFPRDYAKTRPAAFCQEVVETIAAQRFIDDCEEKYGAKSELGRCPAKRILGGCKVGKRNEDSSIVYDWYYDVRDLESSDAGKMPDGGPAFLGPPRTAADVRALCNDPGQYDQSATFVEP